MISTGNYRFTGYILLVIVRKLNRWRDESVKRVNKL